MRDELRAAELADWLRVVGETSDTWRVRVMYDAIEAVLRRYDAEHPADDAEPVTEEWLRSVGFESGLRFEFGRLEATKTYNGWNFWLKWSDHPNGSSRLANGLNTRGAVRRLLSALGIPSTEGTRE